MIETAGMVAIALCIFVLLNRYVPIWAAGAAALAAFLASLWAGL
jgi:hypothetical protein